MLHAGARPTRTASTPFCFTEITSRNMSGFTFGGSSTASMGTPSPGMFSTSSNSSSLFPSVSNPAAMQPSYFQPQQKQPQPQPQQQPQPTIIRPNTPYSSLPSNAKQAIDSIHTLIMRHRQSMNLTQSMAPDLLARGTLLKRMEELSIQMRTLESSLESTLLPSSQSLLQESSQLYSSALQYMAWPLEALAVRRHVTLTPLLPAGHAKGGNYESQSSTLTAAAATTIADMEQKLRTLLLENATLVDRIESLPSPYLWQVIGDLEKRCLTLGDSVQTLCKELEFVPVPSSVTPSYAYGYASNAVVPSVPSESVEVQVRQAVQAQTDALLRIAGRLSIIHDQVERMKNSYRVKLSTTASRSTHLPIPSSSSSPFISSRPFLDATNTTPNKRSIGIGIGDGYTLAPSSTSQKNVPMNLMMSSPFNPSQTPFPKGMMRQVDDPFLAADLHDMEEERRIQEEIQRMVHYATATVPSSSSSATTPVSTTPTTAGSLFSSTTTNTQGGGLFGSSSSSSIGGGLFGSNPTSGSGSSSFFASSNPTSTSGSSSGTTGGLFGPNTGAPSTPSQPNTSSLFSTNNTTPGTTTTTGTTGGLFGSTSSTTTPGGLFGFTSAAAATNTTFGGTTDETAPPPTGGLFSSVPTMPQTSMAVRRKSISTGSSSSLSRKKR